jgi:hypothetical protein
MTVIFAVFIVGIVCNRVAAQSSSQQTPQKSASGQSATLTPQETEAQKHYRIALEAIKNNDFTTASDELKKAAALAPKNALIWYNLAVVESKKGDSAPALEHLRKAESLGLPKSLRNDAEALEAKLSYAVRQISGSSSSDVSAQAQKSEASYDDTVHYIQARIDGQLEEKSRCQFLYEGNEMFNAANLSPHVSWTGCGQFGCGGSINCADGARCVSAGGRADWFFLIKADTDKSKMEKALLHLLDLCGVRPAKPDLF